MHILWFVWGLVACGVASAQTVAPPMPETPAIAAVRASLARITADARADLQRLESDARARHGGELSRDDYARCVAESRAAALARLDELSLATTDPAARVEAWLAYLGFPDERPPRETLQTAYGLAPSGRVRATVLWALADQVWVDEPERGFVLMSRAIAEDPRWSEPHAQRAWIAADAGRWSSVFTDLDAALELAPDAAGELGILRARFELRRGGFDAALDAAQAERRRAGAPRERVVRATLLAATALHALHSPMEARALLRDVLADCDAAWSVLDFIAPELTAPVAGTVGDLRAELRAAAERARGAVEHERTLGIDRETDEERRAREAEELRVAERSRAKARADREAAQTKTISLEVPCDVCGATGVVDARCPHCSGSGRELYKTRTRTERELQGAYWVVRTIEERVPCMQCDGVGVVGAKCPECFGRCVRRTAEAVR